MRTGSVDLAGVRHLPLQELRLLDTDVDLAPLAGHPTLRLVTLEGMGAVTGHGALAELPALEALVLDAAEAALVADELAHHETICELSLTQTDEMAETLAILSALDRPGSVLADDCRAFSGELD